MRLFKAFIASVCIHLLLFCGGYGLILLWKSSALSAVTIDLAGSTLLLRPSKTAQDRAKPLERISDWFMESGRKLAKVPVPVTKTAAAEEPAVSQCPPPCPENPSDWAAVSSTSRKPEWAQGFISESDYPAEARAQGIEGKVKVEVLIDAAGGVRDVHIIQATDSRFADVVEAKLKKAKFEPALDKNGTPIAVHMAIPIIFELH